MRRGRLASRDSARECWNPCQQFIGMNRARIPIHWTGPQGDGQEAQHAEKADDARHDRLRARPITNQSSDRTIWPPSSG